MVPDGVTLQVMYRILALYKQYSLGPLDPNDQPEPLPGTTIQATVAFQVWETWESLEDMDSGHAARELLPLLRKHIDWTKVVINDQ